MNFESKVWKILTDLNNKKGISEIIINDVDSIFVERDGQFVMIDPKITRDDVDLFIKEVARFNQKNFDEDHPILDGILPDSSRVNIVNELYTSHFPAITIRKYDRTIKDLNEIENIFGMSQKFKDFFKILVHSKMNLIISGGTGVGKTTLLNLILNEINPNERIVTIEDTQELSIQKPNIVNLLAKNNIFSKSSLSIRDLVRNTLRMRPDRIIIGEVRGAEYFDLLQAMNTGHEGSMTTIHANNAREALSRMDSLFLLSQNKNVPLKAIRFQTSSAIDFIIHLKKNAKGQRVISEIQEITGMEEDKILTQEIAKIEDGELEFTGLVPSCMKRLMPYGLNADFFMDF